VTGAFDVHHSAQPEVPATPFADAVVLAAGTSERMGGVDKLMTSIAGIPLVAWTLRAVAAASSVRRIIVVARPDRVEELAAAPYIRELDAIVVGGGTRRQDSVANGVDAATAPVVLIHDGARPLVTPELVDRVAAAAWEHGAAVPIVAVPESMREVVEGEIVRIVDRQGLYRSQTPHGARLELLHAAYAAQDPRGPETFVDETTLVQSTGIVVTTVPGDAQNLKVTLPGDDELAVALLGARALTADLLRGRAFR
jgi:2-C-methyl-D-erythritol 4-phosphate cytidylyltransferase